MSTLSSGLSCWVLLKRVHLNTRLELLLNHSSWFFLSATISHFFSSFSPWASADGKFQTAWVDLAPATFFPGIRILWFPFVWQPFRSAALTWPCFWCISWFWLAYLLLIHNCYFSSKKLNLSSFLKDFSTFLFLEAYYAATTDKMNYID